MRADSSFYNHWSNTFFFPFHFTALSNVKLSVTPNAPFETDQVKLACSVADGDDDIAFWRFYKDSELLQNGSSVEYDLGIVRTPGSNGDYQCEAVHNSTYAVKSEVTTLSIASKCSVFFLVLLHIIKNLYIPHQTKNCWTKVMKIFRIDANTTLLQHQDVRPERTFNTLSDKKCRTYFRRTKLFVGQSFRHLQKISSLLSDEILCQIKFWPKCFVLMHL